MSPSSLQPGKQPSPISLELLGRRVRLGDVQWSPDGERLIWLESRPGPQSAPQFPGGQGVLVQRVGSGVPQDLTNPAHSVRGHWGYGGGEFCAGREFALYTEKDGRLYRQDYSGGEPLALTPPGIKISAAQISPDGRSAVCIAIDGQTEWLALAGTGELAPLKTLASGADFYMQPAWEADGRRLAWIEWDHPGLPWEGGRLVLADFDLETQSLTSRQVIAGGESQPVFQPAFSPDGRWMAWIEETGELESLMLLDLSSGERHSLVQDRVLSQPAWEQGLRMFAWETNSKAIVFTALEKARAVLYRATLDISPIQKLPLNGFTWFDHLSLAADGRIAGVASAVHIPPQVICGAPGKLESLRNALPGLPLDEPPRVEGLRWPAKDGTRIYATFTCPPRPTGSDLPPAIIYIHGGPTTQRFARFEVERAYFTSRGFAWVDIDYRGSTGYGRSYRRALYGNWGLVDVEDVFGAAEALEGWGLADPRGLVLYGSSAGGFTLLNSMINHPGGWFAAGLCLYPVTDLLNFPDLDFKLEKHYHEALLGKLPENAEIYRQRSPLFHAAELQDPLALFHGLDDPVVPAEQSRQIAAALQARGSPCVLRLYAGEGHGFRQPETIADMYATMEAFLREHLHLEDQ